MTAPGQDALGLYISIPFCRSKCTYCNFASGVYPASAHERYIDRLIQDLAQAPAWAAQMNLDLPRTVDTVYLGGGTPSLLAPELIARLFAAIRSEFRLDPSAEITVECAPGQLSDQTLAALAAAGVNRVSLGVQSFIDAEAHSTGRLHSRAIVHDDLRRLRAAGIPNLNLDLIAGLPGQTFASWDESLAALIDSGVPHASVYMLEIDEDSRLGREMLKGGGRYHAALVPSDDAIARMYETAIETLTRAGIAQYEISNFARPGSQSRHNLRYWQRRPYLGLGLDASSMLREPEESSQSDSSPAGSPILNLPGPMGAPSIRRLHGEWVGSQESQPEPRIGPAPPCVLRATTTDDLDAYLAAPQPHETAWLSPGQQLEEAWFLGLRLNAGVQISLLEQEFGPEAPVQAAEVLQRLAEDGLVSNDGTSVRLTTKGRLLSNDVFQEFLSPATKNGRHSAEAPLQSRGLAAK